jgi:hypothetical protein
MSIRFESKEEAAAWAHVVWVVERTVTGWWVALYWPAAPNPTRLVAWVLLEREAKAACERWATPVFQPSTS